MVVESPPANADRAESRAQTAPPRRPLRLPPPTKADEQAARPAPDRDATTSKSAGVTAAMSAMHAMAAASAAASSTSPAAHSTASSARGGRAHPVQTRSPDQRSLPPVHTLPAPLTRASIAAVLRDHLSAPFAASDAVRECDPPVLDQLEQAPGEVMRKAHEKIHVFPFKDVRECWLRAWVEGSLARAREVLESEDDGTNDDDDDDWVTEVVRLVDMALILAGGVGREDACQWILAALEAILAQAEPDCARPPKRQKTMAEDEPGRRWNPPDRFPSSTVRAPPIRNPIPRRERPSLEAFQAHLDTAAEARGSADERRPQDLPRPVIITGALDHWPALSDPARAWSNPHYLVRKTLGGRRLVPVEIGQSYTDDGWGQGIITFGEFMQKYMFSEQAGDHHGSGAGATHNSDNDDDDDPKTGYLAQHDLFAQMPSMRADIAVPDYCHATPVPAPAPATKNATAPLPAGHPSFPLLNAWLGPAGTVSPLHTDPYHNVLAQPVGRKYVRLYPPSQRARLYPRGVGPDGVDMGNTSEVDVGEAMALLEGWHGWSSSPPPPSSSQPGEDKHADGGLSKEEAWARAEDLKMRRFDFEERWPDFARAEGCCEAVLEPGDALYVPKGWWHYVRSLSPSFSVSFWWD